MKRNFKIWLGRIKNEQEEAWMAVVVSTIIMTFIGWSVLGCTRCEGF